MSDDIQILCVEGDPRQVGRPKRALVKARGELVALGERMEQAAGERAARPRGQIQERGRVEEGILHLSRLYRVLTEVNEAILRTRDRDGLFREVCRVIVDQGAFRMASIAIFEGSAGSPRLVAGAGAVEPGAVLVPSSIGDRSSVAFPLCVERRPVGILTVGKTAGCVLEDDERLLLDQLAADVSFALEVIEKEAQRRKAEASLRESEKRYRRMVETVGEGIWMVDSNYRTTFVNQKMAEMLGYTVEEMMGLSLFDFTDAEGRAVALASVERQRRGIKENHDFRLRRKDGSELWTIVSSTPIFEEGRYGGTLVMVTDITGRKRAEDELGQNVEKLRRAMEGVIQAMALTVESRDPYTAGHQRRVSQLAIAIASEMALPSTCIDGIRMAATIHDLGKIGVPAEILSKPGRLSDVEISMVRTHSQTGYDVLKTIEFPWPIAQIVFQHHERMNGSGYPQGLAGDKILLEARIVGVADVVEAMASHRPYRPALGTNAALREISQNRSVLYDPDVVDACLGLFSRKAFTFK